MTAVEHGAVGFFLVLVGISDCDVASSCLAETSATAKSLCSFWNYRDIELSFPALQNKILARASKGSASIQLTFARTNSDP
ncbi:hypothetical protein PF011_g30352 [Phytophthora fragariae]|uniref:Secreted protein n=1 Tax=Phytophthora fragariae TaxID=53985 RepID=A0A6A3GR73_9STRA|nr:hypothetical protein PF011_g30352 [Phytophthora fragariae]